MTAARVQVRHELYNQLLESQFLPRDRLIALQRRALERLLKHAKQSVPFYRTRLDAIFRSDGSVDWHRWVDIPILKRADLLSSQQEMQSAYLPKYQGGVSMSSTSGSTGPMVTVSRSAYSVDFLSALIYRGQSWHSLDPSKELFVWAGDDPEIAAAPDGETGPIWGPPWLPQSTGMQFRVNRFANASMVLDMLAERRPSYFTARPKSAQFLALEARRLGHDLKLDAILTYSTGVSSEDREDCITAFGAPIIAQYSSKEAQNIAYQCPLHDHYHVSEEAVLLELLDERDRPCEPGAVGRVIVTQLHNLAQPIIRYDQGDLATAGSQCSCGRTLAVLQKVVGRVNHLFRFPDGSRVFPYVPDHFRKLLDAQIWQIAQTGPLSIEVRYVPNNPTQEPSPLIVDSVTDVVRQSTHPNAKIRILKVSGLERVGSKKFAEFVCEL